MADRANYIPFDTCAASHYAGEFPVCVLGHLRAVKDPFRPADASRLLPGGSRVRVLHLGEAKKAEMRKEGEAGPLASIARRAAEPERASRRRT